MWRLVTSMRTTAALLAVLAALMLLNVVVPQEGAREEAYRDLVSSGPWARFWLETVGLGHLSTSRVFLLVLTAFFLSLAAVLAERTSATLRRARARPPTLAALSAIARRGSLPVVSHPPLDEATARRVLEGFGYRTAPVGDRALWGVKHPAAVLGFPLLHLSFFVLCAGGALIYYTRQAATVTVVEGQSFDASALRVVRRAPWGGAPPVGMTLEQVDVELVGGRPVALAATLRPSDPGEEPKVTRVNQPAEWGALSVLVDGAGLAPVLVLRDARGFTRDRVAVVVSNRSGAVTAKLGDGTVSVVLEPVPVGPRFPERAALPATALDVAIRDGAREVYRGPLAPRTEVVAGAWTVAVEDLRYWASLYLVNERGGALLVLGFALLVAGVVWRMAWFRREVVVLWEADGASVAGRGEFYPARFRAELDRIRSVLEEPARAGVRARTEGAR